MERNFTGKGGNTISFSKFCSHKIICINSIKYMVETLLYSQKKKSNKEEKQMSNVTESSKKRNELLLLIENTRKQLKKAEAMLDDLQEMVKDSSIT